MLQQELRKSKEQILELQQGKALSPTTNVDSLVKGDDSNSRTESAEFRTGNQTDRLTNGNHSVLCSSRTTNQSNKVLEPSKTDSEKKRSYNEDAVSESCEIDEFEGESQDVGGDGRHEDGVENDVNSVRKRTFDESNNGSDNARLIKKSRRGSEISLDYNEDDLCLMNGETRKEDH